jgi:mono/diheme cytochrome c family protein
MNMKWVGTAVVLIALVAVGQSVVRAQPRQTQRSVKDGVYSEAQAERGKQLIINIGCANCHGESLEGGPGEVPPLVGTAFISDWEGQTVKDLVNQVSAMPPDSAGTRKLQENTDIVTLLLQVNGYPAGEAELPADSDVQGQIKIVQ